MGMFDYIELDVKILPDLTEEERILLKDSGWQTKGFENILTIVSIVEDKERKFRHSFTENKFPPYKLQIKDPMLVDLNYTGNFTFYTYITKTISQSARQTTWYEFIGQAENGKITSIKRVKD